MKQKAFSILVLLFLVMVSNRLPAQDHQPKKSITVTTKDPNFTIWKEKCDKLPKYNLSATPTNKTTLTPELYTKALKAYFTTMQQRLGNAKDWLDNTMPDTKPWNSGTSSYVPFVAFVEKITVKTTDKIAFHGDFHGDIHACNMFIQTLIDEGYIDSSFKIIEDNFFVIVLGDYTDRGLYGAEVIYAILRLKIANPTKVFMVRGNHEDLKINHYYGFTDELRRKFGTKASKQLMSKIKRFYNCLPMAIYVICPSSTDKYDVVQCCHGGIEIGYDPKTFLQSDNSHFAYVPKFMIKNGYQHIKNIAPGFEYYMKSETTASTYNGFMWSDFIVNDKLFYQSNRDLPNVFEYGKKVTKKLLRAWSSESHTLRAIFRAHQHDFYDTPMRRLILNLDKKVSDADSGIGFLWLENDKKPGSLKNILVLTFSVSPGTPYKWPYDAFGLLTLAKGYDAWDMKVYKKYRKDYEIKE